MNGSAVCTPQVFLPLKKWEAAWLGCLSAVPVPKATFLKGLFSTWGFELCYPAKKCRKKNSQVTSVLGPLPRGNPSRAERWRRQRARSEVLGCPTVSQPCCLDCCRLSVCYGRSCASHSDLSWYLSAWIPAHHADMSVKLEAFVFHICICWCWQPFPAILELI